MMQRSMARRTFKTSRTRSALSRVKARNVVLQRLERYNNPAAEFGGWDLGSALKQRANRGGKNMKYEPASSQSVFGCPAQYALLSEIIGFRSLLARGQHKSRLVSARKRCVICDGKDWRTERLTHARASAAAWTALDSRLKYGGPH
jgi:hypothetical protein